MQLNDVEKQVILLMAKYDLCISQVAKKMFMHRNTIEYRVCQIEEKTGLSPKRFYDMCKLVDMVNSQQTKA